MNLGLGKKFRLEIEILEEKYIVFCLILFFNVKVIFVFGGRNRLGYREVLGFLVVDLCKGVWKFVLYKFICFERSF